MDEAVGQRANCEEGMPQGGAGRLHTIGRKRTFMHQQNVTGHGEGYSGRQSVQEILQGRSSRNGRSGNAIGDAVVPHGTAAVHHHFLFLVGFFAVETQEAALEAFHGGGSHQGRAHGIAGVRCRSCVQAHSHSLGLQGLHTLNHSFPAVRVCPEDLQEGASIHGMSGLNGKGIVAVGNIGHGYHALGVHLVHGHLEGCNLVFQGRGVPQFVDLVYEARHARTFAEQSFHIGEFHMAVGVHHARAQGAFHYRLPFLTKAGPEHHSLVVHLHECIFQRKGRGKRVKILGGVTFHYFFLCG